MRKKGAFRIESDSLGKMPVPAKAYYGVQTSRAVNNFPVSGLTQKRVFIKSTAEIKAAAAIVNSRLGLLHKKIARAVIKAAIETARGSFDSHFPVDVYQAGAGTSHNMNCNEVIANRALEIMGKKRGEYSFAHPNDHVNMSQSTNDVFPTAMRLAVLKSSSGLLRELDSLESSLLAKAKEFGKIIKSGRTHLQDAVPIMLGQEFSSYASTVKTSKKSIKSALGGLKELGIGGSAVGTGFNTHPKYASMIVKELSKISGITGLKQSKNRFFAMNSMLPFTALSSEVRNLAIELIRIANDLRLLSSGPRTGLGEITLPPVQPGSSIMPGKVNPVMAEMLDMVCFQVIGNDACIAAASQAGQLELNVMMPVINHNLLSSIEILTNGISCFRKKCVTGIKADKARCRQYFESSVGLSTVLNPYIGYENSASLAKESRIGKKPVRELILEKGILDKKTLDNILSPANTTGPNIKSKKRRA